MRTTLRLTALSVIGVWLSLLLAACGGGGGGSTPTSNPGPTPAAPSGLAYQVPAGVDVGSAVSWAPTVTGNVDGYAVAPALPAGLAIDPVTGIISGTPTAAVAGAAYVVTASNAVGSTTATLTFAVNLPAIGPEGEVKLTGTTEPSVITLSSAMPASGDSVTVDVAAPGATSIALTVAGSGCGALAPASSDGTALTQTAAVAASGQCQLAATVTSSSGTAVHTAEFTIAPSAALAAQGLSIANGTYFPSGDPALLPGASDVAVGVVSVPQALINGGSASLYVTQTGAAVASRAVVQFSQVPGYYIAPLTWDSTANAYRIDLLASADFVDQLAASAGTARSADTAQWRQLVVRPSTTPTRAKAGAARHASDVRAAAVGGTTLTVTVSPVSPAGGVGASAAAGVPVRAVGSGPIQVSLSWAGAVDVDLHVTPPGGDDIYYGSRNDSTGGSLDLDSNAGCRIDNVNNENIVWTNSTTPASGTYQVRVDYWSNCSNTSPIPYTVRVTTCGVSQVYSGTLSSSQVDFGAEGAGFVVATFDYQSCNGLSVAGKARYDDYQPTTAGLSSTARALPIRYAQVEVHKSADDGVLATGQTDENGAYALTFSMATPGTYYVKVLAAQSLGWLSEKVVNTSGAIYAIKTPDQDASVTPNATGVDLNARRNGSFAEAFNIFDVGVMAYKEVQARFGITLPALTWRWTAGQATCGGTASCYQQSDNSIYVLSTAADSDEYDDSVLAHEFGHFIMRRLSRDDTPGGAHGLNQQSVPTLAWSEGVASFLGQRIVQSPTYIDTNAGSRGAYSFNVETLPSYVSAGTSDGLLAGKVSEGIVAAILWDLADGPRDSKTVAGVLYTDKIANPDAVYSVLASWKAKTHDRGATGADLVDFVDEWLCTIATTTWEATAGDNFNGLITKLNGFPYTPAAAPDCK